MIITTRSAVALAREPGAAPALMPCYVEVHEGTGLPGFGVVGWPDSWCREVRDRVRAAVLTSGFTWPMRRITVNVPLDVLHPGVVDRSWLDAAIAHGVLAASEQIAPESGVIVGTLGLDGRIVGPLDDPEAHADALLDIYDEAPWVQWGPYRIDRKGSLADLFGG